MMAESLPQGNYSKNNFKSLAAYVLRVGQGRAKDPLEWGLGKTRETEAVAWAKSVNCIGPHLGWSVKEVDATQQMNKRAETCKSYHYVVSFPEGEKPSREILENIEQVLSAAIGYREHQRIMTVHRDTANLHMHVAINRVHPKTFNCIGTWGDHFTLQRTAAELETFHRLKPQNHASFTRTQSREPFRPSWQAKPPTPLRVVEPDLWAQYTKAKQQAQTHRTAALDALRAKHLAYTQKLVAWHKERRANAAKQHLTKANRLSTALYLKVAADKDHLERKAKEKQEREAIKQHYPLLGSFDAFKRSQVAETVRRDDERIRQHAHLHFAAQDRDRRVTPSRSGRG